MILAYLLLLTGLTISSVAIYYSVVGLTAIFSAAAVPIMIMGVSLEVAKLVCATWIKQYWAQVPRLMKTYVVVAVTVLMLITSMGIFGFLSKAHNDQNLVSGDVGAKLAIYDEKIKTARDNIEADRKQLQQMDAAVDQVMNRSSDEKGADKANAIRNSQKRDRASLAKDIESNQRVISQLNDEAAPIRAENRKVEAEVGPIKYIAAFIYGVAPDASMLERAVTWIIIMIVIVFDPLAVIMLLASQMTFAWQRGEKILVEESTPEEENQITEWFKRAKTRARFWDKKTAEPKEESTFVTTYEELEPVVDEKIDVPSDYRSLDEVEYQDTQEASVAEYFENKPEEVVEEYPYRGKGLQPSMPLTASYLQPKSAEEPVLITRIAYPESNVEFAKEELTWIPATQVDADAAMQQLKEAGYLLDTGEINPEYIPDETGMAPGEVQFYPMDERPGDYVETPAVDAPIDLEAAPGRNRGVMHTHLAEADNVPNLGKAANSSFGNEYPTNPEKGDVYLRTDFLPNRLFKFNGNKWIQVDKESTDVYAYEEAYIRHLINEIDAGRYDPESLTDVERQQIATYLGKNA